MGRGGGGKGWGRENKNMEKYKGWEERHNKAVVSDWVVYKFLENNKIRCYPREQ